MKSKLARIALVVGLLSTSIIGTFAPPAKPARAAVAAPAALFYTLTLSKGDILRPGMGSGRVVSSKGYLGSSIDCGSLCILPVGAGFSPNSTVYLTVTVSTGSAFTGWGGACNSYGTSPYCHVTMNEAKSVTALFATIHPVAVVKNGNGAGTVTSTPAGVNCGATCSTTFPYSTIVTLTASPSPGSQFAGWSGDCSVTNTGSCVTTVTGDEDVTATFNLITYTVNAAKAGNGSGSITSAPAGISCGATCSTSYNYNTPITLTASADTGSTFTDWQGDCTANGSSCSTTATGARNVTATFTLITYTVSVTKTGNGTGAITTTPGSIDCGTTCDTSFDYNTVVTLTAAPDTGSFLAGWEGDCIADGLSCATTITGARNITATFTLITYTLSVTKTGNGTGVITSTLGGIDCGVTCSTSLDYNTPVTLTAAADTGSYFTGWEGDCTADGLSCATTVTGTRDVTATFTLITYTVSITKDGNGSGVITSTPGNIDCGGTCDTNLDYNTPVTLTAAADTGSYFAGWQGDCTADGLTCTTTVTGTRDVTATFTLITYTVSVTKTGNGTGVITTTPGSIDCGATCDTSFDYNTIVTLTATADTGSVFTGWTGDCAVDGLSCTTTVTGTRDVTATFTLITYTFSVTKTGNGSGVITSTPGGVDCGITCSAIYDYNTPVTLTAAADIGSFFAGWEGDCAADGLSCTTIMTGTRNVTATFTLITYTVSVTKTGNGSGSITTDPSGIDCGATCSGSFNYTSTVTLTATADTGSTFMGWEGDCVGTVPCTITIDAAKDVTATFSLVTYTLTVRKTGDGTGTVTSDPAGIDCGLTCTVAYDYGTVVTLTQQPITGSAFASWQGDCTGSGTCQVTVLGNQSVTATFNLITTNLGVSQNVTRSISAITFTVVVTNGGPAGANGTIVSDTVTSQIENPQWTCQAANGASCPAPGLSLSMVPSGVYSIYDTLPLFPAGGVVTYTISGNVGLLAQRLSNTVQIFAPTSVTDVSEPDDFALLISGYRVMFPVVIKGN